MDPLAVAGPPTECFDETSAYRNGIGRRISRSGEASCFLCPALPGAASSDTGQGRWRPRPRGLRDRPGFEPALAIRWVEIACCNDEVVRVAFAIDTIATSHVSGRTGAIPRSQTARGQSGLARQRGIRPYNCAPSDLQQTVHELAVLVKKERWTRVQLLLPYPGRPG